MNKRKPSDLQLESDATSRFLPWALAVMVFLAALALAGALALDGGIRGWRHGVSSRLTLQIVDRPGQPMDKRIEAALAQLRDIPGIASARAIERPAVEALLKPWLGDSIEGSGLPLPGLIDIELDSGSSLSVSALEAQLGRVVPGARIDDPKPWLDHLIRLGRLLQSLSAGIVLLVGLASAAMVIFATRASLAARRSTIEVLHLIGAEDRYIAVQFQRHVGRLAALGGLCGWLIAILALVAIQFLASNVGNGMLPSLGLAWWHWFVLVLLPLAGLGLAMLTARFTVLGELRAML